jgi:hypothetical protein
LKPAKAGTTNDFAVFLPLGLNHKARPLAEKHLPGNAGNMGNMRNIDATPLRTIYLILSE